MRARNGLKAAGLVAASALLIVVLTAAGLLAFIFYNMSAGRDWTAPSEKVSAALVWSGSGYTFAGEELLGEQRWAMLIGLDGQVVWSLRKPADVPEAYSLTDVASFTRWYLNDYPVQCRVREDGLLVIGSPKGSVWKHDMSMGMDVLLQIPLWFMFLFFLAIGCVLGLAFLFLRKWFRQAQQVRDAARSDWINGVSHDIRTPLSMVMGYAAQMEGAADLPPERRKQAGIIRAQSQEIRDLVNDLNLTMRLDYEMQPLRRGTLHPAALVRQVAADVLNGGLEEKYALEVNLPPAAEALTLEADGPLLRRALLNLVNNCVSHNPEGCSITLGARAEGKFCALWVEDDGGGGLPVGLAEVGLAPDGGAAHGLEAGGADRKIPRRRAGAARRSAGRAGRGADSPVKICGKEGTFFRRVPSKKGQTKKKGE